MEFSQYLEKVGQWAVTSGLQILLVVVLMIVAIKAVNILIVKFFKLKKEK